MRASAFLLIPLLALSLSACSDPQSAEEVAPPVQIAAPDTLAENENLVEVHLSEYQFDVARDSFVVGVPYTFHLMNHGTVAHEWAVVPHGSETEDVLFVEVEEDDLPPGASFRISFTFPEAGAYDFVCFMEEPVSHAASGMRFPVTVVETDS